MQFLKSWCEHVIATWPRFKMVWIQTATNDDAHTLCTKKLVRLARYDDPMKNMFDNKPCLIIFLNIDFLVSIVWLHHLLQFNLLV